VTAEQLAVDEKMIRLGGEEYWLYGAVNSHPNEILHVSLFSTTTKQTRR
jgi:transposase-like protein